MGEQASQQLQLFCFEFYYFSFVLLFLYNKYALEAARGLSLDGVVRSETKSYLYQTQTSSVPFKAVDILEYLRLFSAQLAYHARGATIFYPKTDKIFTFNQTAEINPPVSPQ